MTNAVDLSTVTSLETGDAFLITSAANGDVRRAPLATVLATIDSDTAGLVSQYASPLTGTTVAVTTADTWLILTPAGTIAALTVTLPTGSDQAEVLITTSATITALTISGGTTSGAPTTLTAGSFARLRYDGVLNVWRRAG